MDVPIGEYNRLRTAGEIVESLESEGYIYFLREVPWSWPVEDGSGHWDGTIIDGFYRSRMTNTTEQAPRRVPSKAAADGGL